MHYLDTSAVVSALVREPEVSGRVRAWLRSHGDDDLAISNWVITEVASALSIKVRTGELTLEQRADAMTEWQSLREGSLHHLAVSSDAFELAARFAGRHELGLRAGDALHLAVAAATGCTLVTLDRTMAKAAPELGVSVAAI